MKTVLLSLFLIVGTMSCASMTGCVVHDRDRVVYERDHPRYYDHDEGRREVVRERHDDVVHGDVHVDVRP